MKLNDPLSLLRVLKNDKNVQIFWIEFLWIIWIVLKLNIFSSKNSWKSKSKKKQKTKKHIINENSKRKQGKQDKLQIIQYDDLGNKEEKVLFIHITHF